MVTVREVCATDVDFADRSGGNRAQRVVEKVDGRVDLGLADRHDTSALPALDLVPGGVDDGFGGPVEVVQQRVERGVEFVGDLPGQGLTADRHPLQRAPLVHAGQRQEEPEQRRHEMHGRDSFVAQQVGQVADVAQPVGAVDHQPGAARQGAEHLGDRHVETR